MYMYMSMYMYMHRYMYRYMYMYMYMYVYVYSYFKIYVYIYIYTYIYIYVNNVVVTVQRELSRNEAGIFDFDVFSPIVLRAKSIPLALFCHSQHSKRLEPLGLFCVVLQSRALHECFRFWGGR